MTKAQKYPFHQSKFIFNFLLFMYIAKLFTIIKLHYFLRISINSSGKTFFFAIKFPLAILSLKIRSPAYCIRIHYTESLKLSDKSKETSRNFASLIFFLGLVFFCSRIMDWSRKEKNDIKKARDLLALTIHQSKGFRPKARRP